MEFDVFGTCHSHFICASLTHSLLSGLKQKPSLSVSVFGGLMSVLENGWPPSWLYHFPLQLYVIGVPRGGGKQGQEAEGP
jgi:hypothetical protein